MSRILPLAALLALLGCVATAPPGTQPASGDEAAVRALDEQERVALLNQDVRTLQRLWAEEFIVNAPINQVSPSRDVVIDLMRQGLIQYSSFERTIEQLRISGDVAVVMGAETVRATGRAPLAGQTVRRRFTHIWQRNAGTWRLIARHANNVSPM